ncbi:MAG: hypothetical protein LIO69_06325 [Oscillospiraceae bacterium]|nr:hypothetical protein [Oscillospiraceae bacterium]
MEYRNLQNGIYKNAEMGITALEKIIPSVSNHNLKSLLVRQYDGYKKQAEKTTEQLKSESITPEKPPLSTTMMSKAGIAMKLAMDDSTSNIAKMLIQGTNMGIIELNKEINRTSEKDGQAVRSAREFLDSEQRYLDQLKTYL